MCKHGCIAYRYEVFLGSFVLAVSIKAHDLGMSARGADCHHLVLVVYICVQRTDTKTRKHTYRHETK